MTEERLDSKSDIAAELAHRDIMIATKDDQIEIERLVMMPHFLALMDGLEIPNPEWYLKQNPEILRKVGAAIAHQAKYVTNKR